MTKRAMALRNDDGMGRLPQTLRAFVMTKGKIRCFGCKIVLSKKEVKEHLKSEQHLKKTKKIEEAYKASLDSLTNFKGL